MFLSITYLLALVLILTVHECSHAWVANRLGDPTAHRAGRLTLNPLAHLDLLGTLMLFFVGIGWGKPVPVNPRNFEHPVRDEALTAFAGPLANLLLAIVAAVPYTYLPAEGFSWLVNFSGAVLDLSLVLFLFNMLPFPPLDGSKFIRLLVPHRLQPSYENFMRKGMPYFIVLLVMDLYLFEKYLGFSFVWTAVSTATFWLKAAILLII